MDRLREALRLIGEAGKMIDQAQDGDPDENLDEAALDLTKATQTIIDVLAFRTRRANRDPRHDRY